MATRPPRSLPQTAPGLAAPSSRRACPDGNKGLHFGHVGGVFVPAGFTPASFATVWAART